MVISLLLLLVPVTYLPPPLGLMGQMVPLWMRQPGGVAIYRRGPMVEGEFQSGSFLLNVTWANTTHITLQISFYTRGKGWGSPHTYKNLPLQVSSLFWLAPNATIGSPLRDHFALITSQIANMTPAVDEDDAGGPGTWQEGILVTIRGRSTYRLRVLYDASCLLALQIEQTLTGLTHRYHLHQTNIDLGPSIITHQLVFVAAITTVTLLILGGVPLLIIRAADYLQRRKSNNNESG